MHEPEQPSTPQSPNDRFAPRQAGVPGGFPRRTNYQLPPRPSVDGIAPQPQPNRVAPLSPTPAAAPPQSVSPSQTPQAIQPQPVAAPLPAQPVATTPRQFGSGSLGGVLPAPASSRFATSPAAKPAIKIDDDEHQIRPYVVKAVLVLGVVLCLFGAIRWLASGSLAGKTVTLGAVVSTGVDPDHGNGYATKIQFVATDGKLHDLYLYGSQVDTNLVPGTAIKVAYVKGRPDTSAVEWSKIESAQRSGIIMAAVGSVLALGGGVSYLRHRRQKIKDKPEPQAQPQRLSSPTAL